jgi:hypothetical protein
LQVSPGITLNPEPAHPVLKLKEKGIIVSRKEPGRIQENKGKGKKGKK